MSSLNGVRDAIDLVAPTMGAAFGIVEHAIFGEDVVDGRASPCGVVFPKDVAKISDQKVRNTVVGHSSPRRF
jgi:hypothetical protein